MFVRKRPASNLRVCRTEDVQAFGKYLEVSYRAYRIQGRVVKSTGIARESILDVGTKHEFQREREPSAQYKQPKDVDSLPLNSETSSTSRASALASPCNSARTTKLKHGAARLPSLLAILPGRPALQRWHQTVRGINSFLLVPPRPWHILPFGRYGRNFLEGRGQAAPHSLSRESVGALPKHVERD